MYTKSLLKKSGGILCKGKRLAAYRFIRKYQSLFGLRWLLRRLSIYSNAYYNYLKKRKSVYQKEKREYLLKYSQFIMHTVVSIMRVFLQRKNICLSALTVHKYMNRGL